VVVIRIHPISALHVEQTCARPKENNHADELNPCNKRIFGNSRMPGVIFLTQLAKYPAEYGNDGKGSQKYN